MTSANIMSLVPDPSAVGVRAIADTLLNSLMIIERALGDLGREREQTISAAIDAFSAASKDAVTAALAVSAHDELEAIRKTFDQQEQALHAWQREVTGRLVRLAADFGTEVLAALNTHLDRLVQQESLAQDNVDEVRSVITEYQQLRAELENKRHPPTAGATKKTPPTAPR